MKVPSAVVTAERNIVINTLHRDFKKVKSADVLDFIRMTGTMDDGSWTMNFRLNESCWFRPP